MSQTQLQSSSITSNSAASTSDGNNDGSIPVTEKYWALVAKADKKFSKIRDLPSYQRAVYDTYFYKVFKIYTQLWKYQQENRQQLVEAGLNRWEIGEIASRIGQLYFGQYMRTSEASYLSEAYMFYEAILTREYFKDGLHQDVNLASKQLRFLGRFLTVCLVLNRREMVYQLVNLLKMLLDECKRTFQETDFKEWKLTIQEIVKFLKADTSFMNRRPLRYSVVLDLNPDAFPCAATAKRNLRLRDALLCSYHPNEVKFSEFAIDTFRMLQCLEWEPSGSFYQSSNSNTSGHGSSGSHNEISGHSRVNKDMTDVTLPPNSRKALLFRPSVTHFMAVLGTICDELPSDGVLLMYISASGTSAQAESPCGGSSMGYPEDLVKGFQLHSISSDSHSANPISTDYDVQHSVSDSECLQIGHQGQRGMNCIYPSDILPFTRRPLFLIIDSESSKAFKVISGSEKGEPIAMLLSPATSLPFPAMESSRQPSGSLFTSFLTAPLQSFLLLLGFSGNDVEKDLYDKAEVLLQSSLNSLGSSLASCDSLDPVWAQVIADPFLRRLILRFILCRAVLSHFTLSCNMIEFLPECMPCLPEIASPISSNCQAIVSELAKLFGATKKFTLSE